MKSYYLINKETDLLDSYDLPELQMYPHILSWLIRMGKKEGVTPAEDWGKVKSLKARVKNHISFHAHGVKPSEIIVDFFSPEVRKLFITVYGNGSETYTKDWLDAFEAVRDAIDRQVGNDCAMCQYGAASGKRCDKCQCPAPLPPAPLYGEVDLRYYAKVIKPKVDAEKLAGDAEKPRFVVQGIINRHCHGGYRIYDTHKEIANLYTEAYETAKAIAELLNESQSDDVGMGNEALEKYLTTKVKKSDVIFWNEIDTETGHDSLLDAMEDAGTGVPMSEDGGQYVCNDCGARFDDNYDAAKHWVTTHMTAEWFIERFSMGIKLNQQEIELLIKAGSFNT